MRTLWQDLRYALRMLWRSPGFTAVSVLSLAFGIGANTAIFSLIDTLMLRSIPVRDPGQLVELLRKYPRPDLSLIHIYLTQRHRVAPGGDSL